MPPAKCKSDRPSPQNFAAKWLCRSGLIFIFLLLFGNKTNAQTKKIVLVDSEDNKEYVQKDSLSATKFLDSLAENNYYFTKIISIKETSDKALIFFDKGKNYNEAYVKLPDSIAKKIGSKPEFKTKNLDSLRKTIHQKYLAEGFTFSRLKTKYLGLNEGEIPQVSLSVITEKKRTIDGFKLEGYTKPPKRFVKNLEKDFRGKTYGEKNLAAITKSLQNHPFLILERAPQTLFRRDSTQIYLFLKKKKSNTFDGVIGFGNDQTEKFTLNGTINVNFQNIFYGFEAVNVFWQRNPDKGQTFDLKVDIPYIFNSYIGLNLNTNIFRQDSTFANVRLLPSLYLNLSNRQKIGLRGTFETSSVIAEDYANGSDYSKKGIGIWYDFTLPSEADIFLYKTKIRLEADQISAKYVLQENQYSQNRFYYFAEHNQHLQGNQYLNLKSEGALLNSKGPLTINELMRFGGWNSMRGFNENTLTGDFFVYAGAEYRYLIGNQAFFDFFGQYGQLNNKTLNLKPKLYSVGLGFNFFLPVGLMSFQISNGSQFGNNFRFGDTKIHWGILSKF